MIPEKLEIGDLVRIKDKDSNLVDNYDIGFVVEINSNGNYGLCLKKSGGCQWWFYPEQLELIRKFDWEN